MHPHRKLRAFLWFNLVWALTLFSVVHLSHSSKPATTGNIRVAAVTPIERAPQMSAIAKPPATHRLFTWRDLESQDYVAYIVRLRAAGCPETTVRQIIVSDVQERMDTKRREAALAADGAWWQADALFALSPAFPDSSQSLEQERTALLGKHLGTHAAEWESAGAFRPGGVLLAGRVLGSLTPEKHNAVQDIVAASALRQQDYRAARANDGEPANPVELACQREQMRGELARILAPLELEEFLLRYSHNAQSLRLELRGLDPTPDEFRNIFAALDSVDTRLQLDYGDTAALSVKQLQEYERQRDRAIQGVLAPKRYAIYIQSKSLPPRPVQTAFR